MKLSGSPTKKDIGDFTACSDGYSSNVEYLTIQINNLLPTAHAIQNHTLILGNSLIFTVNQSAFSDCEGQPLTYTASLNKSLVAI